MLNLLAAAPAVRLDELRVLLAADSGDTAWLLALTLALFGCGVAALLSHRSAARQRLAVGVAALVGVLWIVFGYSLGFAPGGPAIGGTELLGLRGLSDVRFGTAVPESAFALWECAVALFILAGALVALPRAARGGWVLSFAALWLAIGVVPVAHWLRGGGWLMARGVLDQAGAVSVHLVLGVGALVLTRFGQGRRLPLGGGAAPGAMLAGTLVLVAGSALTASDDASTLLLTALAGGSAGALVWLMAGVASLEWEGADLRLGAAAGIVAVGAGSGAMGLIAALGLGAVAAGGSLTILRLVPRVSGGVTTAAVHAAPAALGALIAPLMILPALGGAGLIEGGPTLGYLFGAQSVAVLSVTLWAAVSAGIAGLMVSAVVPATLTRREAEALTPPPGSDRPADAPSA